RPRPRRVGRLDGVRHDPLRPLYQLLHVREEDLPARNAGGRARGGLGPEEQGGLQGGIRETEGKGTWHSTVRSSGSSRSSISVFSSSISSTSPRRRSGSSGSCGSSSIS